MNIRGLLLLLTVIRFYIPELSAQIHVTDDWETLRGLKGIHVKIEKLRDDAKKAGLTQSILKTDVELKLRKAGIRVLTKDEIYLTPGVPHLYVNVRAIKPKTIRGFVYSARVEFAQRVILPRNRSIETEALTWTDSFIGITPDLRDVREVVGDLVDQFMNDYLAVNPK